MVDDWGGNITKPTQVLLIDGNDLAEKKKKKNTTS